MNRRSGSACPGCGRAVFVGQNDVLVLRDANMNGLFSIPMCSPCADRLLRRDLVAWLEDYLR